MVGGLAAGGKDPGGEVAVAAAARPWWGVVGVLEGGAVGLDGDCWWEGGDQVGVDLEADFCWEVEEWGGWIGGNGYWRIHCRVVRSCNSDDTSGSFHCHEKSSKRRLFKCSLITLLRPDYNTRSS